MAVSSYQMAVAQGRRSGQPGRVVPSGPAGNITYKFVPFGGGGGTTAAPTTSGVSSAALTALRKAKEQYAPGGGFGTGVEAVIERGRVKAMASGMQGLVSAGLAGTTMAGTLGKKYEEEVGVPARLSIEEERARAISGIEMAEAGMGFQTGEAGLQRGFQASESAASRSLQMYIANLQTSLQRRPTVSMRAPTSTTPTGGYARQFPSLYSAMNEPAPPMPGDGTSGLVRPEARQYDLPVDEERFNISW